MDRCEKLILLLFLTKESFEFSKVKNFESGDLLANALHNSLAFCTLQFDGLITESHCVNIVFVEEQLIVKGLRRLSTELLSE